jgi:hypothetical protein
LKFISKSGENKKSPDFATQSGRLFGLSPIQGKRVSVIPADQDCEGVCKNVPQQCNCGEARGRKQKRSISLEMDQSKIILLYL